MPRPTLAEMIVMERDGDEPDEDLSNTSRVRRALLRGETLSPKRVVETYGGSNGLLAQVCSQLSRIGFHVHREHDDDGLMIYRLLNPRYDPTPADYENERSYNTDRARNGEKRQARNTTAPARIKAPPQAPATGDSREVADRGDGLPPLPDLGQSLTVYALAQNDDGSITLGLRNGTMRWVTTVDGAMGG